MTDVTVIAEEKDFLVVNKPAGLPSAPITPNDSNNAFAVIAAKYPETLEVKGRKEIEHGLVHRLDTVTSGLMIIARTQAGYDNLLDLQKQDKITKVYTAVCERNDSNKTTLEAFPELPPAIQSALKDGIRKGQQFTLTSYFRAYGEGRKQVRPVTEDSGKAALNKLEKKVLYTTQIRIKEIAGNKITVECEITNGYRHQIRCHLAWLGFPIIADPLYNTKESKEEMSFAATEIKLPGTRFELA